MTGHVFHPGHHELHGITVVVRTTGAETYVGRFDREDDAVAHLKDVGVHTEGPETWDAYLQRTKRFGIKVEHRQLTVPRAAIVDVRKLADVS